MSDLLAGMLPSGLQADQDEDLRAGVGLVATVPPRPFEGHYAESAAEVATRAQPKAAKDFTSKLQRGLKDVVVTLPLEYGKELRVLIDRAKREHGLPGSGEVVLWALRVALGVAA